MHWSSLYKPADESLTQELQPSYSARSHSKFLFHQGHEKGEWLPNLAVSSVLRIEPNLSCLPGLGVFIVLELARTCPVYLVCVSAVSSELGQTCLVYLVWVSALFQN